MWKEPIVEDRVDLRSPLSLSLSLPVSESLPVSDCVLRLRSLCSLLLSLSESEGSELDPESCCDALGAGGSRTEEWLRE